MHNLANHLTRHPVKYSVGIVFTLIFFSQFGAILSRLLSPDFESQYITTILRLLSGGIVVFALIKLRWEKDAFVSTKPGEWPKYWFAIPISLSIVGFINLLNTNWDGLVFSYSTMMFWFFDNLSTGVFEETMMRAIVFCLLLKAWGTTRAGVFKAAVTQALIFGLVHLLNLLNGFSIEVFAQVIWATFMGFGFAGAVIYGRSIWPSVIVHGFINAMANIDNYFAIEFAPQPMEQSTLIVLLVLMFVIAVIPGYLGIAKSMFISNIGNNTKEQSHAELA